MALEFDESEHRYSLDGVVLPSVTTVINAILPQWQADQWAMDRGTATHHGCRLLDEGRLDWSSVDPEIEPRIRAWQKFRREFPSEVIANEQRVFSAQHRFAGAVDRILEFKGGDVCVCDLKNSVSPQVVLQLAAYSLAWTIGGGRKPIRAVAVELLETAEYRCHWFSKHELRRAEQQFLAVLTVFNFAREHNLLRKI